MEIEYIRDYAMYAAIFGIMSFVWFGWAQEAPRKSWRAYIGIASGIALLFGLSGVYLSVTNWDAASALRNNDSLTTYIIVFWLEIVIGTIGVIVLFRMKKREYTAPWIALIVGVHFIFLAEVFNDYALYLLAVLMTAAALISPWMARKLDVAYSAVTGISSGVLLFMFAVLGLIRFLTVS